MNPFKLFKQKSLPIEVKETLDIIDDISKFYHGNSFLKIQEYMKKCILNETEAFVKNIQSGTKPKQWVYVTLLNTSGDLLETGSYHIYRGILSPEGNELLKIYESAIDMYCTLGYLDLNSAEEQKETLKNNLKKIG